MSTSTPDKIEKLIKNSKYDEALNHLNALINKDPYSLPYLTLRAKVLYKLNQFEQSIIDYNQLINLAPEDLEHIADRGLCYHMNNDPDLALEDFDTVVARDLENPYWYACRAFIKDFNKDYEGSLIDYEKVLSLDPDDAIALNNKGLVEEKLGYMAKAQESFKLSDELHGIDLEKEIGHLNIPLEADTPEPTAEQDPAPVGNNHYMDTLKKLISSSKERNAFFAFLFKSKE
jgi:tetratricopeptide (TPR) repeat protein